MPSLASFLPPRDAPCVPTTIVSPARAMVVRNVVFPTRVLQRFVSGASLRACTGVVAFCSRQAGSVAPNTSNSGFDGAVASVRSDDPAGASTPVSLPVTVTTGATARTTGARPPPWLREPAEPQAPAHAIGRIQRAFRMAFFPVVTAHGPSPYGTT